MIKSRLTTILLLALTLAATLLVSIPLSANAAGASYYVDGTKGIDTNVGTAAKPWKTLQKATATIRSGDTVVIAAGIYRITPGTQWNTACLHFGPAGTPTALTTFKAAAGARVIITTTNGNPVDVTLEDFVRVDGLWFGGAQDYGVVKGVYGPIDHAISLGATNGAVIGEGKQIVNSTIWGYHSGIISGSTEYALIQNNRMLLNGADSLWHGIYISGNDNAGTGGASTHIIIDNNTLIGGGGYGIHAWHITHNLIVTRNFVAGHNWGSVLDGSNHLEANNFFWKEKGQKAVNGTVIQAWGPWLPGSKIVFDNNVLGPSAWLKVSPSQVPTDTIASNAYANWSVPPNGWPGTWRRGRSRYC